jgi:hypothetical protein
MALTRSIRFLNELSMREAQVSNRQRCHVWENKTNHSCK